MNGAISSRTARHHQTKKARRSRESFARKKILLQKEEDKLTKLEKERNEVKSHREAKLAQLRETLDEGSTTTKIQQMKYYLKVVDEELKGKENKVNEQKKHVDAAQKQVETARQDLLKKQQDVEKLLMHRKEWEKEIRALEQQQEAIETDEMGSGMFIRRKPKPHKKPTNHKKK